MLNYADCETLRTQLVPRLRQAVRKYLLYLAGGGGGASSERIDWARNQLSAVDSLAEQISHYCMSEPGFLSTITRGASPELDTWSGGTSISDTALQSRTESVLQSHFDMPA